MGIIDTVVQMEKQKRSLDENGVRYLISMRMYVYSSKALGYMPKALESRDICWAYYSESQDILLDYALSSLGKLTWKDARALGMGYWLKNPETLVSLGREDRSSSDYLSHY